MALAISGTGPAAVQNTVTTTATLATASFTPPADSLLLVMWGGNTTSLSNVPANPTITDSLTTHLTYTLVQIANPTTVSDTTHDGGQATIWWAHVVTSAAMTITVTNQAASGNRQAAMRVIVLTGADNVTPISSSGVNKTTTSVSAFSQSYTPARSGGSGFMSMCDWNNNTSQPFSIIAASGSTQSGGITMATGITTADVYRTVFDDVAGVSNSIGINGWTAPDPCLWAWAVVQVPASPSAHPKVISQAVKRAAHY